MWPVLVLTQFYNVSGFDKLFKRNGLKPLFEAAGPPVLVSFVVAHRNERIRKRSLSWENRAEFFPQIFGQINRSLFILMKDFAEKRDVHLSQSMGFWPGHQTQLKSSQV